MKPCTELNIYTRWRPKGSVKVLFIAESPPRNSEGYFYNPKTDKNCKPTLRVSLFELLEIGARNAESGLQEFKDRGFFLVDTIKCRCRKRSGSPPRSVIRTCATKWLPQELSHLRWPKRICILGKTAQLGLSMVNGFQNVADYRVTSDCGKTVKCEKVDVLIWPFPSRRNRKHYASKVSAFRSFCHVAGS